MRLGVFGGTFNPIHYGHLRAAEEIRQKLELERILFVPTGSPPLKSGELASANHRWAMAELAVASNECFEVSDIECSSAEVSYSVNTAARLRELYPEDKLFFIVGIDAFADLHLWHQPEKLIGLMDFVIMSRPGFAFAELVSSPYLDIEEDGLRGMDASELDMRRAGLKGGRTSVLLSVTPLGISATGIRDLLRKRLSIKYLLPEKVESFIMSNGLYNGS
jgi:nicotinate-nucleotide adenylyltransferase